MVDLREGGWITYLGGLVCFEAKGGEKAVCNTGKTLLIETLVTEIAFNQKQPITKQI